MPGTTSSLSRSRSRSPAPRGISLRTSPLKTSLCPASWPPSGRRARSSTVADGARSPWTARTSPLPSRANATSRSTTGRPGQGSLGCRGSGEPPTAECERMPATRGTGTRSSGRSASYPTWKGSPLRSPRCRLKTWRRWSSPPAGSPPPSERWTVGDDIRRVAPLPRAAPGPRGHRERGCPRRPTSVSRP